MKVVDISVLGKSNSLYVRYIKRVFDIIIGLIGTIFILLPASGVLFLIYLFTNDKGKLYFSQERLGINGKKFKIYKFRSMVENAENVLKNNAELYEKYIQNSYKLPPGEDPRLTVIGHFIRSTSIDELPQFLNVLKGDMSFIGPRPILPNELNEYNDSDKSLFLSVKPGITGWWQVSGRSEVMYPERCQLELYYPKNISWKLDVKILWLTFLKVLRREGAH